MNNRSLGMLIMAVVCGLGAMYGTTKLLSKDNGAPVVEEQDVVIAEKDLRIEEVIRPEMLKVVRMAKSAVQPGAFTSIKDVDGRWVQIGMVKGDQIVDAKLAPPGNPPGLISRIPKGMRAFAVEVNEQTGVSGFILPDHRVDVVQIVPNDKGQPEAETVLQDVLVLASGQQLTRPGPEERSMIVRTVTLAVTPDQVDILVAAKQRGALSLSMRGLNDHDVVEKKPKVQEPTPLPPPPPPEEKVVEKTPDPPPPPPVEAPAPPPPPPRFVTVYRGLDNMKRYRIDQPDEPSENPPAESMPPETPPN